MRRPDGRWIVEAADLGVEMPVMIHRARLHELITARFGPGVTVRTGVEVGEDELGRSEADLVVLADGIRSTGRQYLYPDHPGPRYSGCTAYRGIAEIDVADGGGESWGRGKRFGLVQLIDGRWYWYATANCPPGQPAGPGGHHADVLAQYGDWHYPIPELLAATPPDQVLRNDLYDLPLPLVPFRRGNVVLLGDAAHAMTPNLGRGACTAIEDADALARCLTESPDLDAALARYDAERRPVATTLVKRSRQVGVLGQLENPVVTGLRDAVLMAGGRLARLRTRR